MLPEVSRTPRQLLRAANRRRAKVPQNRTKQNVCLVHRVAPVDAPGGALCFLKQVTWVWHVQREGEEAGGEEGRGGREGTPRSKRGASARANLPSPSPPPHHHSIDGTPPWLERALISVGVCHFMLVLKDAAAGEGEEVSTPRVRQLCLAPVEGGDVSFGDHRRSRSDRGPRLDARGRPLARATAVPGVVREATLSALPPRSHRVGIVRGASSDDIAALAKAHDAAAVYELCRSDCRHFVDAVVEAAAGVKGASAAAARAHARAARAARGARGPATRLLDALQDSALALSDAANWPRVRRAARAVGAAAAALAAARRGVVVLPAVAGVAAPPRVRRAAVAGVVAPLAVAAGGWRAIARVVARAAR